MPTSQTSRTPSSSSQITHPRCLCGKVALVRTSNKPTSMGMRFYGCANYWETKCGFLEWIDSPCDCGRDELVQKIDLLERQLDKTKAEERRQRGMLWATWLLILCFLIAYLAK
ncbi:hypothetical protein RHSIM_Rhsim10G0144600 [Rhododendron simsii]|uniref:GRF-type domain-containing protein n=1 Tax=Rhododendron simsii TaxID=118357 RepID=A0A834GBP1_RHOSS|nr:hypothetical protein RHSIM_Rhsim10G0144600 [Rhododendron simsii]